MDLSTFLNALFERLSTPLNRLDPELTQFSAANDLLFKKEVNHFPDRVVVWKGNPEYFVRFEFDGAWKAIPDNAEPLYRVEMTARYKNKLGQFFVKSETFACRLTIDQLVVNISHYLDRAKLTVHLWQLPSALDNPEVLFEDGWVSSVIYDLVFKESTEISDRADFETLEAPLRSIDSRLESFGQANGFVVDNRKDDNGLPQRVLLRSGSPTYCISVDTWVYWEPMSNVAVPYHTVYWSAIYKNRSGRVFRKSVISSSKLTAEELDKEIDRYLDVAILESPDFDIPPALENEGTHYVGGWVSDEARSAVPRPSYKW